MLEHSFVTQKKKKKIYEKETAKTIRDVDMNDDAQTAEKKENTFPVRLICCVLKQGNLTKKIKRKLGIHMYICMFFYMYIYT